MTPKQIFNIFVVVQILDGIFTFIGVTKFGPEAEGNYIIYLLINMFGTLPALLLAKSVAIVALYVLCKSHITKPKIMFFTQAILGFYVVRAILPWMYVLL